MDPFDLTPGTRFGHDIGASLRVGAFRWLWISSFLSSFGMYASLLVLTWLALEIDGSALAVGVVLAARVLPQLILGIPAGALADGFPRARLVKAANVGSTVAIALLCLAWQAGASGLLVLVAATFLIGSFDAIRGTAGSAMAFDLVGRRSASTAIALSNLAAQVSGIFAGIVAGYGLSSAGPTATLVLTGLAYALGALAMLPIRPVAASGSVAQRERVSLRRAATLIGRNRQVALIAVIVTGAEVLAFSNMTLLPSFARDVFGIGAAGLGWLLSARAIGGTLGLLAVATSASRWRTIGSFAFLAVAFGVVLIAFAVTSFLAIALILAGAIGAVGAAVDTVGQSQVQHAVNETERGSAMGVWMFCLGLGLVGHIETGLVGSVMGAPFAQVTNGVMLVILASLVGLALPAVGPDRVRKANPARD